MLLNVFNVFLKGDVSTCFQSLKGWVKSTNLCRRSVEAVVSRSVDLLCRRSVEAVETRGGGGWARRRVNPARRFVALSVQALFVFLHSSCYLYLSSHALFVFLHSSSMMCYQKGIEARFAAQRRFLIARCYYFMVVFDAVVDARACF